MSFCFNFDLPAPTTNLDGDDGYKVEKEKKETAAKSTEDDTKPAEPLKEAKEHLPLSDPRSSLGMLSLNQLP
ncbi:Transcription initiation factor TFIID subunit 2 [Dissostichus eleginoides]|uniref:Transcription initiation factor TFIID subunit 2 n=1 Tax=Dissostichus eleginoides TaxID=100907 RepID=A0AAD9FGK4_DISEL|nr:Transcription initiation factor TFIID subunit 2 [Dissostichus eleginoides]